ncbi:trypsin-like peptidase domain-containing protein [Streptomyces phyllanthi]|uniref:PDZ domain-containing protein n=1 Tax=Streptomyces phyllanthi TaxID=1803180 RepID=A0A5N8W5Q4_9ACTN|nr:trypsin-like peptidase domain-containing protein [Streptomyces phyllanthi]MPY42813.1 PDZ domain-containing protein [Streptomyces phyllanthi]
MNEGKPTKAKWWSRPRAQGTGAGPTTDHISAASTSPEAADAAGAPEGVHPGGSGGHEGDGGDFELRRPDEMPAQGSPADDGVASARPEPGAERYGMSDEGDFELERPAPAAAPAATIAGEPGSPSAGSRGAGTSTGAGVSAEAVGAVPADDGDGASASGSPNPASADHGAHTDVPATPVPADHAPAAPVPVAPVPADGVPVSGGTNALAGAPAGPVTERPKPLHDPDPYSTPPYGEPGPWAPAPPVQHPGATPAHGTAVPAMPPPHGVPTAGQVPAPGAPVPTGGVPHGAPVPPHAVANAVPAPAPGTPAPAAVAQNPQLPHAPGAPYAAGSPPPGVVHTGPPPRDPWQNYDPWAAAQGPLQQNGAAVLSTDQRRRRSRKALALGAVLLALVSGGVGGAVGAYLERNGGIGQVELPQTAEGAGGRAPDSVAGIAASALPGVVTLHVSGTDAQGTGTGFVLDKRGHILTNNHVVEPAGDDGEISVTFSGGETAKATVVGRDSGYDLAVVKVSGVSGLKPLPLGNSDDVRVGDPVVAIGAPFDLANTVTSGIISAKERPITAGGEEGDGSDVSYVDALQTDAPINPGNSGGPLVDANARVIGINSAIRSAGDGSAPESGQAGSIGLGFAIPINQGKRVAEELINTGKATHPVIGVTLDMDYSGDGARVGAEGNDGGSPVNPGGPAARAGIKAGDVITAVDGQRVHSGEELIVKIRAHRPGDRLELTLRRDGRERKATLTLGSSGGD